MPSFAAISVIEQPIDPNDPFIQEKMVLDLPELEDYTFGGMWGNPNPQIDIEYIPLDLRYIHPNDNDQHSEYNLRIYNSTYEAEDHFENLIDQSQFIWDVTLKEINGNKVFVNPAEFIQGWGVFKLFGIF